MGDYMDDYEDEMFVTKRDGRKEEVAFDKILNRIRKLGNEAKLTINYTNLAMKVIDQLHTGISTGQIDELTAQQSAHPDCAPRDEQADLYLRGRY